METFDPKLIALFVAAIVMTVLHFKGIKVITKAAETTKDTQRSLLMEAMSEKTPPSSGSEPFYPGKVGSIYDWRARLEQ